MIRTLLERLGRGRSFRRWLDVGGKRVPIIVSPDAQLKYLRPGAQGFDRDLILLAERELADASVVWDVGANIGSFAVAAATVAAHGRVIAIEADTWLVGLLRRTAREAAHGGRIDVLPCAVAGEVGVARFLIAARGRASNALEASGGRSQMGGVREVELVPTLTLDLLMAHLPRPGFVKIDVEGAELDVLRGAAALIADARPTFYVEVDEQHASPVFALFAAAGYAVLDPGTGAPLDRCLDNTLFRPRETQPARSNV